MMDSKDHIKNLFSSKLKDAKTEVPPELWSKIEDKLPNQSNLYIVQRKSNKRLYSLLSIAASIGTIIILCYIFDTHKDETLRAFTKLETTDFYQNSIMEDVSTPKFEHQSRNLYTQVIETSKRKDTLSVPHIENPSLIISDELEEEAYEETSPISTTDLSKAIAEFEKTNNPFTDFEIDQHISNKNKESLSLSIGATSGLIAMNERVQKGTSFVRSSTMQSAKEENLSIDKILGARNKGVEMEHDQPISFGLKINKRITQNLYLESGIVYTYLSSKIRSNPSPDYERYESQHFHYLGVPLSINYKFAEWSKVKFYISSGGMIQKDVYGKFRGKQNILDMTESTSSIDKKMSQKFPQLSLNSSLGATYPIYKKMAIYSTIGAAYYFENDNRYRTIFQDKKIQLDLNLGIKFEL